MRLRLFYKNQTILILKFCLKQKGDREIQFSSIELHVSETRKDLLRQTVKLSMGGCRTNECVCVREIVKLATLAGFFKRTKRDRWSIAS